MGISKSISRSLARSIARALTIFSSGNILNSAKGLWFASEYDSQRKAIPNKNGSAIIPPIFTRNPRGMFATGAYLSDGGSGGWLGGGFGGCTTTAKYAAGIDGQAGFATRVEYSSGTSGLRYRQTPTIPAGTYTLVSAVKSNTGSSQTFRTSKDGLSTYQTNTATTSDTVTLVAVASASTSVSIATGGITSSSFAAGAIDSAAIATDAIGSNEISAAAVTKIQTGLATPTNITAGVITTVTNLTNAPTNGDLTATMKTSVTTAATASTPTVASVTNPVTVGTNNDKTGYALSSASILAIWDYLTSGLTTVGSIGKLLVDNISKIVGTIASGTHNPQSGDSYARLGAPVRASISADLEEVIKSGEEFTATDGSDSKNVTFTK